MRISDWSSDVCSSDLNAFVNIGNILHEQRDVELAGTQAGMEIDRSVCLERDGEEHAFDVREPLRLILGIAADKGPPAAADRPLDRKSVVSGKRVSVRVDLGGRRYSKKKKNTETNT